MQDAKSSLNAFEIHHIEWSVNNIEVRELQVNYPRLEKLIGDTPDKIHYSKGVQVIAWEKQRNAISHSYDK